jgi:N6-adenosine-specific RNA methylase IME4
MRHSWKQKSRAAAIATTSRASARSAASIVRVEGGFGCLLADPPWGYKTYSVKGEGRAPDYQTLPPEVIATLPVKEVAARGGWLALWVTGTHLPFAFAVASAWGFPNYSSLGFVWLKLRETFAQPQLVSSVDNEGCLRLAKGKTTRHNVELCLLFKRGSPKFKRTTCSR